MIIHDLRRTVARNLRRGTLRKRSRGARDSPVWNIQLISGIAKLAGAHQRALPR